MNSLALCFRIRCNLVFVFMRHMPWRSSTTRREMGLLWNAEVVLIENLEVGGVVELVKVLLPQDIDWRQATSLAFNPEVSTSRKERKEQTKHASMEATQAIAIALSLPFRISAAGHFASVISLWGGDCS